MNEAKEMLEKDRVLRLLDSEIDYALSKQRRPGWTTWVLVAALGTVFWLFFSETNLAIVSTSDLVLLFISISVFMDSILGLCKLIAFQAHDEVSGARFFLSSERAKFLPQVVVRIIHFGLIIVLLTLLDRQLLWLYKDAIYVFYGLTLFLELWDLVASFFRVPLTRGFDLRDKVSLVTFVAILCLLVLLMLLSVYTLLSKYTIFDFVEIRMSGLLVAASFLFFFLSLGSAENPLVASLIEIRRALTLGGMELNTAIKQADIAIVGMRVEDVLQEDVRKILGFYEKAKMQIFETQKKMRMTRDSWPDEQMDTSSNEYKEKSEMIDALMDSVFLNLCKIRDVVGLIKKETNGFNKRASYMAGTSKKAEADIDNIMMKLNSAHDELIAQLEQLESSQKELKEKPKL